MSKLVYKKTRTLGVTETGKTRLLTQPISQPLGNVCILYIYLYETQIHPSHRSKRELNATFPAFFN